MNSKRGNWIGGIILITIGFIALFGQFIDIPALDNIAIFFVAALGAIFLVVGIVRREAGFMVPGGILSGIGWGIVLTAGPWTPQFSGEGAEGGLFMLAFAAGWVLITVFTALFTKETYWWALIPGGIIGLIGAALLFEGGFASALELLATWWPLLLIIAGISTLLSARRMNAAEKDPDSLNLDS